eukprot:4573490-Pyramimonas_sp.AAC.1
MRPAHPFRRTPRAFRGPVGGSTEKIFTLAVFTIAYGWVFRQDNFGFPMEAIQDAGFLSDLPWKQSKMP